MFVATRFRRDLFKNVPNFKCKKTLEMSDNQLVDFSKEKPSKKRKLDVQEEKLDEITKIASEEFECGICTEIFIKPVVLSCYHTFCYYCIHRWRKLQNCCPICRKKITVTAIRPINVLSNFLDRFSLHLPVNEQITRHEIAIERLRSFQRVARSSNNTSRLTETAANLTDSSIAQSIVNVNSII
ncbi:E3 ubiquitin-protein ligase rnf8 [Chamberlinius hualienensis]